MSSVDFRLKFKLYHYPLSLSLAFLGEISMIYLPVDRLVRSAGS